MVLDVLSIPSPAEGSWYLGPLPLRGYALSIIAGIGAAIWIAEHARHGASMPGAILVLTGHRGDPPWLQPRRPPTYCKSPCEMIM